MILIALICVLFGAIALQNLLDRLKNADFYKINGPTPLPIIGNALLLLGKTPAELFTNEMNLVKKYGSFYRFLFGDRKIVMISDPELVAKVLASPKYIKKSDGYSLFRNWLGNGLLVSNGSSWRRQRKMITPAFHFKTLPDYASFMKKNLQVLIEVLSAKTDQVINIHHIIKLFALDTICDSAMRYSLNAQLNVENGYVRAIKRYLEIFSARIYSVIKRDPRIFQMMAEAKEQDQCAKIMHDFTDDLIKFRKEERSRKNSNEDDDAMSETRPCFLDLLLDCQEEEKLTDVEIRDEVTTFVFGGHDTVSSTIAFCLYELAKHPEVQRRLVEESWSHFGKNADVDVNNGGIQEMSYLDLVIKECMRIYTTVPAIERELEEDIVFNGLVIRKGTNVKVCMYAMHHSEKYYPNPEKFDPDRFTLENAKTRHQYAYIPFSAGPRNCIGFKYGILLTKATVINILRNFEVVPADDPKYEPILFNNVILESKNGVNIQLRTRKI